MLFPRNIKIIIQGFEFYCLFYFIFTYATPFFIFLHICYVHDSSAICGILLISKLDHII